MYYKFTLAPFTVQYFSVISITGGILADLQHNHQSTISFAFSCHFSLRFLITRKHILRSNRKHKLYDSMKLR